MALIVAALGGGKSGSSKTTDTQSSSVAATQSSSQSGSKPETSQSQAPAEAPIVVTADQLADELKANALKAANTYKGKTVEVTGLVATIDSSGKYFTVTRTDGQFSVANIQLYIKPDMKDKVANLQKDQSVTIVGKVKDVGEFLGYSIDVSSIK